MGNLYESMMNFQFYGERFRNGDKIHRREGMQKSGKAEEMPQNIYR